MAKKEKTSSEPGERGTAAENSSKLLRAKRPAPRKSSPAIRIGRLAFSEVQTLALDEETCAGHVFGETSVLSNNASKLAEARRFIAAVAYKRQGNGLAKPVIPSEDDLKNPNTLAIWEKCKKAASDAANDDIKKCKHFVIWFSDDDGKTPSKIPERITDDWPYEQTDKITDSWGPFKSPIKPKGSNIFVIKYCGVP